MTPAFVATTPSLELRSDSGVRPMMLSVMFTSNVIKSRQGFVAVVANGCVVLTAQSTE